MGQNIIVVNGKQYDAKTGQLVAHANQNRNHAKQGTALDGFSRRPKSAHPLTPAHKVHQKTKKSQTLMRGVVQKPHTQKLHATANATHTASAPMNFDHIPQFSNQIRAQRAKNIPKSKLISRFGTSTVASDVQKSKHTQKVTHVPVKKAPPLSGHHTAPLHSVKTLPNPFEVAIQRSSSHQQTSPKRPSKRQQLAKTLRISPRMVSAGSLLLAVIVLGGFFVYQNIPNLAMRVAAARSGVPASLPGYKPAGFAMNGPIKYSAGKISIQYHSTTDERNFVVNQSTTKWNNETLLDNFVNAERRSYQTYQDNGKTIYIYNDNNATWIDKGIWYQIEGASALTSSQLLRIAKSL